MTTSDQDNAITTMKTRLISHICRTSDLRQTGINIEVLRGKIIEMLEEPNLGTSLKNPNIETSLLTTYISLFPLICQLLRALANTASQPKALTGNIIQACTTLALDILEVNGIVHHDCPHCINPRDPLFSSQKSTRSTNNTPAFPLPTKPKVPITPTSDEKLADTILAFVLEYGQKEIHKNAILDHFKQQGYSNNEVGRIIDQILVYEGRMYSPKPLTYVAL